MFFWSYCEFFAFRFFILCISIENRKKFILSKIEKRQVIITSCEPIDFSEIENINFVEIENGKKKEAKSEEINMEQPVESDNLQE